MKKHNLAIPFALALMLAGCTPQGPKEEPRGMLSEQAAKKKLPLTAGLQKVIFKTLTPRVSAQQTPFFSLKDEIATSTVIPSETRSSLVKENLETVPAITTASLTEPASLSDAVSAKEQTIEEPRSSSSQDSSAPDGGLPDEELAERLSQLFFDHPTPANGAIAVATSPLPPITPEVIVAKKSAPPSRYQGWITLAAFLLGAVMIGAPIGCFLHIRYLRQHRDV